jgi:transcriptional regulator with XRE-family HTH domain
MDQIDRRGELASTLRAWRDRLTPEAVGLESHGVRRAPGLQRQELAQLAGVSFDYVTKLEQGRASAPSASVLDGLSRALMLSRAEREHLFNLAGRQDPAESSAFDALPRFTRRMVEQLDSNPVAVCNSYWTPIAWNPMWSAVGGDPMGMPSIERNVVWRQFAGLPTPVVRSPDQVTAYEEALVADLRGTYARRARDARLELLVRKLIALSDRFRRMWESRRVDVYDGETKLIRHTAVGQITVDCEILSTRRSELRVVVYTAKPGSESARRMDLLLQAGNTDDVVRAASAA